MKMSQASTTSHERLKPGEVGEGDSDGLDKDLWIVVEKGSLCSTDDCVYRDPVGDKFQANSVHAGIIRYPRHVFDFLLVEMAQRELHHGSHFRSQKGYPHCYIVRLDGRVRFFSSRIRSMGLDGDLKQRFGCDSSCHNREDS